jgi:hypothetical protein
MKSDWINFPLSVFVAAVHTTFGGIIISALACCVGQLSFWFVKPVVFGSLTGTDLSYYLFQACNAWLLCPLLGTLGLWGIPFFIIQIFCFYQIVWEEKPVFHRFFIIAYSQLILAFLTQLFSLGWSKDSPIALGFALLVLGIIHGVVFWIAGLQQEPDENTFR